METPEVKVRAYNFSIRIIKLVSKLPNEKVYWVISDQLLRSATSIGANIIEAQAASSKKDFANFYNISLKSANETKYWLGLLRDATDFQEKEKIEVLLTETHEIANILGASMKTLRKNIKNEG